jgi:hypothetical protein
LICNYYKRSINLHDSEYNTSLIGLLGTSGLPPWSEEQEQNINRAVLANLTSQCAPAGGLVQRGTNGRTNPAVRRKPAALNKEVSRQPGPPPPLSHSGFRRLSVDRDRSRRRIPSSTSRAQDDAGVGGGMNRERLELNVWEDEASQELDPAHKWPAPADPECPTTTLKCLFFVT